MATKKELLELTEKFFKRHWNVECESDIPQWNIGWSWQGSVPHHDKGGVYALFSESGEVMYVGLATSTGGGKYDEHGISRRLTAHVIKTDKDKGRGNYLPQDKWLEIKDIGAIGFPAEYTYLAAALEDFLIRNIKPPKNAVRRRGKVS